MRAWRRSLVARLALWAVLLFLVSLPVFWMIFSTAVERISVQVVETRLLELANQVRGYRASEVASRELGIPRVQRGQKRAIIGADADWVWQIAEAGTVTERSELLVAAEAALPLEAAPLAPQFRIGSFETPIGQMRLAGRTVNEPTAGGTVPVQYLAGISETRFRDRVDTHASRLENLALLAAIPVSLVLFGMLVVVIAVLRGQFSWLGHAMERYENAETDGIEGEFPEELRPLVERMNAMLRQNAQLIERTRKYVSKIAHDINHPLAIMKNSLRGEADTDVLDRQINRMTGLVDRYSSLARAIGPDSRASARTEIAPLLADVADGFSIVYRRTPLEIDHACLAGLWAVVPHHDLEAILSNLVSNAHKFAEGRVLVSADTYSDGLRLRVEDDGPGIPEAEMETAFNWGQRLDQTPPGTGFGLSIVRDIVDLYEGRITPGRSDTLGGLRIEIDLPVRTGTDA